MPANNSCGLVHYLAGKHEGKVGWIFSPGGFHVPRHWIPYAVDNGKFSVWSKGAEWQESKFIALLDRCRLSAFKPLWVVVPDEVANRSETLRLWDEWEPRLRKYRWPLAFVVQDGMTPADVPESADVVFVGGTTDWKWRNVERFSYAFPRVHVGRVNWPDKLEFCESVGVESCDGTGWFRDGEGGSRSQQLQRFLAGERTGQLLLSDVDGKPECASY